MWESLAYFWLLVTPQLAAAVMSLIGPPRESRMALRTMTSPAFLAFCLCFASFGFLPEKTADTDAVRGALFGLTMGVGWLGVAQAIVAWIFAWVDTRKEGQP